MTLLIDWIQTEGFMMILAWFSESLLNEVWWQNITKLGACKITFTMLMLYFKRFLVIQSIERCSSVSIYCLLNVEEAKLNPSYY